uniref:Uncharacterized protein n=1 Tax=Setaria viridis TaxID=4556 RepID=A0A4U6T9Q1_SETVI|nr:hypothetical protein SEVIR_9G575350v2 [Setaria viridis]
MPLGNPTTVPWWTGGHRRRQDWQDEERSDSGGHGAWASAWYACPRQRLWQGGMRASSSSSSNDSARGAHRVLDEMLEEGRRDKRGDVPSTRHVEEGTREETSSQRAMSSIDTRWKDRDPDDITYKVYRVYVLRNVLSNYKVYRVYVLRNVLSNFRDPSDTPLQVSGPPLKCILLLREHYRMC